MLSEEDVFEASALRFFHRLLQKMLRWVPFGVFLHFLLKFKHFDEFFPFQNVIANLCVCCVHPLNKDISQAQFKNQSACIKTV